MKRIKKNLKQRINKITNQRTIRYSTTLLPYTKGNSDWQAERLYEGGKYLILPEHKNDTDRKKKFIRNAYIAMAGITAIKLIHYGAVTL